LQNEISLERPASQAYTQEFNMKHLVHLPFLSFYLALNLGCNQPQPSYAQRVFCDAETTINGKFISQGASFDHSNRQTNKIAFSGKHSVLLQKGGEYGMTCHLNDVKEGERFIIRVKRHSKTSEGSLELAGKQIHLCYFSTSQASIEKSSDGWDELELDILVPYGVDSILIYLRNSTEEPVYFDDLEILRYEKINPVYSDLPTLELFMDSLDMAQMVQLRDDALKEGIIDKKAKKEFKCAISYNGEHFNARIRFKGDWTDHLKTNKWSFRIKLDGGRTIMGKRTFSIQHPETRGYAKEWLIHKILQKEGVLTTMYEFIPVELNGKVLGLYAIEEHFTKQLLESQNRREGVILKFNEDPFWESLLLKKRENIHRYYPTFVASVIEPFGKKKVLKSDALKEQFIVGQGLCEMYRTFHPDVDLYLDVETYTKYLAVLTLANCSSHSTEWHNQRWYVNPVTAKLEPIAFDFSGFFEFNPQGNKSFTLFKDMSQDKPVVMTQYLKGFVLKNQFIQKRYLANLERMIDDGYLDSILEEMDSEIKTINQLLGVEFPGEQVEVGVLKDNIVEIKKQLPDFKKWLQNGLVNVKPDTSNKRLHIHSEISTRLSVRAYKQAKHSYVIENNGGHKIRIFGYKSKGSKDTVLIPTPLEIGVTHWRRDRTELTLTEKASAFYYTMDGSKNVGKTSVFSWPAPEISSPRLALIKSANNYNKSVITKEKQGLRIREGSYVLNELLYIPKGTKLIIEAGTKLIFKNTGGILSESPIIMEGSIEEPIIILSESAENRGLTVLQANAESILKHVQFQSMNNLSFEGWILTGGINFYESDVVMDNCNINDARSEDALNIIRSNFELNSCKIKNSMSDGFDSDFSKGSIINCRFTDIGNDAVDFSGSQVELEDCEFLNIGDKAVSVGEQSVLTMKHSTITNAKIGVAAKDRSHATLSDLKVSDCEYGYVAYTKKAEYGGATIEIENIRLKNVEKEGDIELNSRLIKDGVTIQGTEYSKVSKY
jgi:spore coat protein CotH